MPVPQPPNFDALKQQLESLDRLQGLPAQEGRPEGGVYQIRPAYPPDPGIDPLMTHPTPPLQRGLPGRRFIPEKGADASGVSTPFWQKALAVAAPALAIVLSQGKVGRQTAEGFAKAFPEIFKRLEASPATFTFRGPATASEGMGTLGYIGNRLEPFTGATLKQLKEHPRFEEAKNFPANDFFLRSAVPSATPNVGHGLAAMPNTSIMSHEGQHALPVAEGLPSTIGEHLRLALHNKILAHPEGKDLLRFGLQKYPDLANFYAVNRKFANRDVPWSLGEVTNELLQREQLLPQAPAALRPALADLPNMVKIHPDSAASLSQYTKEIMDVLNAAGALPTLKPSMDFDLGSGIPLSLWNKPVVTNKRLLPPSMQGLH